MVVANIVHLQIYMLVPVKYWVKGHLGKLLLTEISTRAKNLLSRYDHILNVEHFVWEKTSLMVVV